MLVNVKHIDKTWPNAMLSQHRQQKKKRRTEKTNNGLKINAIYLVSQRIKEWLRA